MEISVQVFWSRSGHSKHKCANCVTRASQSWQIQKWGLKRKATIAEINYQQARSKHKMTGGPSKWRTLTPPTSPPQASVLRLKCTSWYMSNHYICLQYVLFLSLIFRLCWLWPNKELVWDIVGGKFSKQLLSVFFLHNKVISYVYRGRSICSVLVNMQHHMVVQSRVSKIVELKCVFPLLKAEDHLSPMALVAGMTSNSFPRVEISPNSFQREIPRDCMKVT